MKTMQQYFQKHTLALRALGAVAQYFKRHHLKLNYQSTYKQAVAIKISFFGFSSSLLLSIGYNEATALMQQTQSTFGSS